VTRSQGKGRGFASMTPERVRELGGQGGKAAHASGNAFEWNSQEATEASQRGHAKRWDETKPEREKAKRDREREAARERKAELSKKRKKGKKKK